ncbi:MAG: lysophospholipid acyltransferase family protein [Alphaproteobacteria bacterium GM7ARS4]|nr:lysophospholipid acyltransferase family protein [Alphaproteobacteria bacterium GM7ARS4]
MLRRPKQKFPLRWYYVPQGILLWCAIRLFRILGLTRASHVSARCAEIVGPHLATTKIVLCNLRQIFPAMSEKKRHDVMRHMWRNIGRIAAEYPFLKDMRLYDHTGPYPNIATIRHVERLESFLQRDKPVICVSAHFGNWEIAALVVRQLGYPITVAYRPPNNPFADRMIGPMRDCVATHFAAKNDSDSLKKILSALQRREAVGFVTDQKFHEGTHVRFMGYRSACADTPARLAVRFHTAIVPIHVCREQESSSFTITIEEPIFPSPKRDNNRNITKMTQQYFNLFETWIRAHPDQWLWTHNRWNFPQRLKRAADYAKAQQARAQGQAAKALN